MLQLRYFLGSHSLDDEVYYEKRKISSISCSQYRNCWIHHLHYFVDPRRRVHCFLAHWRQIYPEGIYSLMSYFIFISR